VAAELLRILLADMGPFELSSHPSKVKDEVGLIAIEVFSLQSCPALVDADPRCRVPRRGEDVGDSAAFNAAASNAGSRRKRQSSPAMHVAPITRSQLGVDRSQTMQPFHCSSLRPRGGQGDGRNFALVLDGLRRQNCNRRSGS
jgi:hypothetical protein